MKSIYLSLLFSSLVFAETSYERIVEPTPPRTIQVLIEKDIGEILLEVKGPYHLLNPHDKSHIASGLLGKRFIVRELENGLKWGEEFPGIHQFTIQPRSPDTSIFINGIQYSGSVSVFGVSGMVNIVNDIDIESYVKSILTAQFLSTLEPEVLSSLAILVRTDAYHNVIKNQTSFWHIAAQDVSYAGCALVVSGSPIDRAVDSTRHLILVHPASGEHLPFATTWTENSAGKTIDYATIFRKETPGPSIGVSAPIAALSRQASKWEYSVSKKNLAQLLGLRSIKSVEAFVNQPSNKVYGIRVKDGNDTYDIDFFTLQSQLGKNHILSSDFTISLKDENVLFSGFGKGHGAGLCLYSASALAQNGENAVKILSKFFPETYLYNLNAPIKEKR